MSSLRHSPHGRRLGPALFQAEASPLASPREPIKRSIPITAASTIISSLPITSAGVNKPMNPTTTQASIPIGRTRAFLIAWSSSHLSHLCTVSVSQPSRSTLALRVHRLREQASAAHISVVFGTLASRRRNNHSQPTPGAAMSETHEKNRITLISVAAAFVLTVLKLVVGLLTGSLGLISEAAHSGLDFVASIITFAAIRIAGRPADENHPYGHGRVENLAATVQGLLLIGTAVAIIFESVRRFFFAPHPVEASVWTFVVMTLSIVVDLWRSRLLARAARRFHSSALEADALNFRADMFSSSVVIVGLTLVAVSNSSGGDGLLARADAGAALVVAMVIIAVSGRMMFRAVNVLLDRAPITLQDQMTVAVADVPGVVEAHPVRLRESGDRLFADVVVSVPRTATLAEAHMITQQVEESLRTVESRTETVVHFEPAVTETETAADRIRAVAQALGVRTHHEIVHRVGDAFEASLHVEVPPMLSFGEAYSLSQRLVAELQRDNADLHR
ncbi:MAG: cation diffusion facilitator family transporter [Chloroflexia bacterium]